MSKNIKPSVTVNTQEFGTLLRKYRHTEFADNTVARIALISYIDAHIEQAVERQAYDAMAMERDEYKRRAEQAEALAERNGQAPYGWVHPGYAGGNSVWIDGVGDVALATQQPSAEPINFENVMAIFAKQTNRFAMEKYADTFERIAQAIVDEFHNPPAHDNVLSKPAQQDDGELPPLPEPVYLGGDEAFGDVIKGHTDDAMREYGRLCRATRQPAQQDAKPLTDTDRLTWLEDQYCCGGHGYIRLEGNLNCAEPKNYDLRTAIDHAILAAAQGETN